MFITKLTVYRLKTPLSVSATELEKQLEACRFRPCGPSDFSSFGWVSPRHNSGLVLKVEDHLLLTLKIESKILPGSVINKEVKKRAARIEQVQGRTVGRKELRDLKEAVTDELLAKAFTKEKHIQVWIDTKGLWLGLDVTSSSQADSVVGALAQAVSPPLELAFVNTKIEPRAGMSDWLASREAPPDFTLDNECELEAMTDDKASVKFMRHNLDGEEVVTHLADGKVAKALAITYKDRVSCILTKEFLLKKLALTDVANNAIEKYAEGAEEEFDADFLIMAKECSTLIPALVEVLGGLDDPDSDA